jgi:uncharacterized protein (TIGR00730 family)
MKKNNKLTKMYILFIMCIAIIAIVVTFIYIIKKYNISNNKNDKINITIFASSKNTVNKEYFEKTRELITKLNEIKDDINVIYGGGEGGLMGEISKYKGNLISSNLKKFVKSNIKDEYVFEDINDRQEKLIELGDVYIILPGGYGTHYELLEVMTLNDIKVFNKPIIFYNINNFFDKFINYLQDITNSKFIENNLNEINSHVFYTPDEVVHFIKALKQNKTE